LAKQQEYRTIIRLAGVVDPSYTRAMRDAMKYADQFLALEKPEFGGHFVLFFWMCFELFWKNWTRTDTIGREPALC